MAGAPKGNRNAARKHRILTDALRRELLQYEADGCKPGEAASLVARNLIKKALGGDKDSISELYDRVDGKPAQTVDMNINDERPDRDTLIRSMAELHARLAGRSDGRGTEPATGSVPPSDTTH